MSTPDDAHRHPDRSALHGRRSGKPLTAHQRGLMHVLLPRLALDVRQPLNPAMLFPQTKTDLWLEVGFGAGEHLLAQARQHTEVGFIGVEPFLNGMARFVADIAVHDIENVRLYNGDAGTVIDRLPDAALGRVFIFYPDPWPKRRQRKRRFLSDDMLARLARVMRSGAELRFATDIDDYCGWTLARIARSPHFVWSAQRAADWQQPWDDWVSTRYERKAIGEGRRPCYITAVRR